MRSGNACFGAPGPRNAHGPGDVARLPVSGACGCCRGRDRWVRAPTRGIMRGGHGAGGQTTDDPGPASRRRFDGDGSAMQLDQALDQRQTEADARRVCTALERLDIPRAIIGRRDGDPGIGDGQQQIAAGAFCSDADGAARRGEFYRIRDQVEERLLEPPFVAPIKPISGGQRRAMSRPRPRARSAVRVITPRSIGAMSTRPGSSTM